MRVLHWYPNFLAGGGVANALLGLAQAQAELGAEVAIAAAEQDIDPLYGALHVDPRISVRQWRASWTLRFGWKTVRWVGRHAAHEAGWTRSDVVHVHGEFNVENLCVPRLFDVALVLSPHGAFHSALLKRRGNILRRLYMAVAGRFLYRHLHAFHALTPSEARDIARVSPGKPVFCVPQGPGPAGLGIHSSNSSRESSKTVIRFIFVGRLDAWTKGLDLLLDSFAATSRRLSAVTLALQLVGPDWKGGEGVVRRRAEVLGLEGALELTGACSGPQVAQLLAQADIYVQLSRHEGMPLSVTEALLAGKPAILSREIGTVSYSEIATLQHVRLVPPDVDAATEAMVYAVEHLPELRRKAGEASDTVRSFFSWPRVARLYLEQYEHLIHLRVDRSRLGTNRGDERACKIVSP